jgi:hypothetical protein
LTTLAYPQYTETPQAVIQVFDAAGAYKGQLKYPVVDSSPVGLAVDNSAGANQGRVYVTSGSTVGAKIYAYPPNAAIVPSTGSSSVSDAAAGAGLSMSRASPAASGGPEDGERAGSATVSQISQKGNLRIGVSGRIAPRRLPCKGRAPVRVTVGGEISTADGSLPPQLRTLRIELNRHGALERRGLPLCPYGSIQPGSTKRALAACRSSLVGTGSFEADIVLAGAEPYPSSGRLLVFNARKGGRPVLFGHIHTARPFSTSFVIVFELRRGARKGPYGIALFARIPRSMDSWGRLSALEMTLGRHYRIGGERRSYLSAGCPAPEGFPGAIFPLARTSFTFSNSQKLTSVLTGNCRVRTEK